jgi:uncharacterized protein (TIGR00730 family)
MKSIAVYCGSSDRVAEEYLRLARDTGRMLAESGIRVIYGAGSTGLMGALATAAMDAGGEVIGVMPAIFNTPQLALPTTTGFEITSDIHARLARMIDLSDGFIILPGGYGTMDEFFQTVTWAQIGLHTKPVGLLNHGGYYDKLLEFLDQVEFEGFMYSGHNGLYVSADTPQALLSAMEDFKPLPFLHHWLERDS